jgi:hypothetical protein
MKNTQYEKGLQELQDELLLLEGLDISPLEKLRQTLPLISGIINDIRAGVLTGGFPTVEAEIHFFKKVKPQFYALLIYETRYFSLCSQAPAGTKEMIKAYYEDELGQLLKLFQIDAFHYQYYKTKATELDQLYFVRGAQPTAIPVLDVIDPWPGFSTAMDYSFAKFIAYERLRDYLVDLLIPLQREVEQQKLMEHNKLKIHWTGETINLVELAYGIWLTGQVNHGNASITEIVQWLEVNFNVKIGLAFRRWYSISKRKRLSTTKYIDELKAAILKRLDEENGLK